jgi:hypothetical protein
LFGECRGPDDGKGIDEVVETGTKLVLTGNSSSLGVGDGEGVRLVCTRLSRGVGPTGVTGSRTRSAWYLVVY